MNPAAVEVALGLGARIVWLPTLSSRQDFENGVAAQLGIPGPGIVVTADPGLAEEARAAALQVEEIELPRADTIASLGWKKILTGKTVLPAELDANYIRRSSEIFSKSSS